MQYDETDNIILKSTWIEGKFYKILKPRSKV